MLYAIREDDQQLILVQGTFEDEVSVTELDYCKTHGWKLYTLEQAISMGAHVRNESGNLTWLGINVKVKIEDHALYARWLGKWRAIAYYSYSTRKPSDKWVQKQLEKVLRINIPLDPVTKILWHWEN